MSPNQRLLAIDCARGVALVGMVVFHVAWDLHYFGFSAVDPNVDGTFHWLGHAVAGTFLFLSGFSLVLADRAGATLGEEAFRLLMIGAAALAITLVSWLLAPAQTIFCGILHCVVITNCAALALRRSPILVLVALAVIAVCLPHLLRGTTSGLAWQWLGLGAIEPNTLDFRPFFPWLGPVLLGVAAARTTLPRHLKQWRPRTPIARWIGQAGRHSLSIYLVHQPAIFALLYLLAYGMGNTNATRVTLSDAAAFVHQCVASCIARGKDAQFCTSTCHCVMTDLLRNRERGADTADTTIGESGNISRLSQACLAQENEPTASQSPASGP